MDAVVRNRLGRTCMSAIADIAVIMVVQKRISERDAWVSRKGSRKGLAAGNFGDDVHLTVGADCREPGILKNLTVDGNGNALLKMRREGGMKRAELGEKLAHVFGLDIELALAVAELLEISVQDYARHTIIPPRPPPGPWMLRLLPTLLAVTWAIR